MDLETDMTRYYRYCVSCKLLLVVDGILCKKCMESGKTRIVQSDDREDIPVTGGLSAHGGRKWISSDDRDLVKLYRQGTLSVSNLSIHFGRSRLAIQSRLANTLGLEPIDVKEYFDGTVSEIAITPTGKVTPSANNGSSWTSHDEAELIKLYQEGISIDLLSDRFARSKGAIETKLRRKFGVDSQRFYSQETLMKQIPVQRYKGDNASVDVPIVSKTGKYRLINIPQSTRDWHRWRQDGIGASDASTIMSRGRGKGVAKFINQRAEKLRIDSFQNKYMAEGKALEPHARALYNQTMENDVVPICVESIEFPWLRASLDGLSVTQDKVIEIKCGPSTFSEVQISGRIPTRYYAQVQHILAIIDLDSIDFWCYRPETPGLLVVVERDDRYINRLLQREAAVWTSIEGQRMES